MERVIKRKYDVQPFKIFGPEGILIGSVKYPKDAAILATYQGEGATIRFGLRKWQTIYEVTNQNATQGAFDLIALEMDDGIAKIINEYKRRLREGKTKRLPALERSLTDWAPQRWIPVALGRPCRRVNNSCAPKGY